MNKIRTPRGPRNAQRQGFCHVSVVIERLLAMYGITLEGTPSPTNVAATPSTPAAHHAANLSQQTFAWFGNTESQTDAVMAQR